MFSLPSAQHLVGQFTRSWHSEDAATWPKRFLVPGDLVGRIYAPNEEMKKKATQIVRNQKDGKRETWEDNGNL